MHLILILLGTSAIAWVLRETDYIVPVTAVLVILLLAFAVNPGVAVFMLMAIAAIILLSLLVAFLPQVLGFILGAVFLIVCIILAGAAVAGEQRMEPEVCGEIISDIAEMEYYAKGWKDAGKPIYIKDREYTIVVFKDKEEVLLQCKDEMMRITKRPHQVRVEGTIQPVK